MLFWFLIALMTGAAIFAVLLPLARGPEKLAPVNADLAVYRDQLAEIERDRARGFIAASEVEGARTEVSRRLLAAADAEEKMPRAGALTRRRAVALMALIGVPLIAGGLYLTHGSPNLPGAPLAARLAKPPEQQDIALLVRRIETHLKAHPDDGRGWEVIAPVYSNTGRYAEAVTARNNALRLLGPNADREADYGDALVAEARGRVDPEARAAFERAAKIDPAHAKARFFLGLAAAQEGRRDDAATIWKAVAELTGSDDSWRIAAARALKRLGGAP
jgi:cytochrome c-type biogenesis protein CcmH